MSNTYVNYAHFLAQSPFNIKQNIHLCESCVKAGEILLS